MSATTGADMGPCGMDGAVWVPSQNCGPRREARQPDMILLHYTAMKTALAARDWLCAEKSQVSAHYVLAEDGLLWQLVCEQDRAWHAGAGAWGDTCDVNSASIGIEIANDGASPFPEPQMTALERLVADIKARWSVPPERILGHSDVALGRKIDPGARFDWTRLARRGLAVAPDPTDIVDLAASPGSLDFQADARTHGYVWAPGQEDALLHAVRLRFRPWAKGAITREDRAVMRACAVQWPVNSQISCA